MKITITPIDATNSLMCNKIISRYSIIFLFCPQLYDAPLYSIALFPVCLNVQLQTIYHVYALILASLWFWFFFLLYKASSIPPYHSNFQRKESSALFSHPYPPVLNTTLLNIWLLIPTLRIFSTRLPNI